MTTNLLRKRWTEPPTVSMPRMSSETCTIPPASMT
jgi:hypothetical protein